jgi:triosephosphate isomerase
VSATLKDTNIKIGSQNLHHQDQGAYTGEVSANMLRDLDVTYVIIGHSERRQYNFETEEIINKKLKTAFSHDIIPILCCGENLEQREQGITIDLIRTQIKTALHSISKDEAKKIIIAYEPIWAIGTGLTASAYQAEEICLAIRTLISEVYDQNVAESIRILYGGSVNEKNSTELFNCTNIDGALVGGASLKIEFKKIIEAFSK